MVAVGHHVVQAHHSSLFVPTLPNRTSFSHHAHQQQGQGQAVEKPCRMPARRPCLSPALLSGIHTPCWVRTRATPAERELPSWCRRRGQDAHLLPLFKVPGALWGSPGQESITFPLVPGLLLAYHQGNANPPPPSTPANPSPGPPDLATARSSLPHSQGSLRQALSSHPLHLSFLSVHFRRILCGV